MGLLCLSRKAGERIWIDCPDGSRIEIVALDNRGQQQRVGILAPREYQVTRPELTATHDSCGRVIPCGSL